MIEKMFRVLFQLTWLFIALLGLTAPLKGLATEPPFAFSSQTTISPDGVWQETNLILDIPDLSLLQPWTLTPLNGPTHLTIHATREPSPILKLSLSSPLLNLTFNGTLPLKTTSEGIEIDWDAPLQGDVTIRDNLSDIMNILMDDPIELGGLCQLDLAVKGTLNDPIFSGSGSIEDGFFEIQSIGTSLRHLTGQVTIDNNKVTVTNVTAVDSKQGQVTGEGAMSLDFNGKNPFSLDLTLQQVNILNLDELEGAFSGQLRFAGDLDGATLSGAVEASQASFAIPERPSALVDYVEVTYINQQEGTTPPCAVTPEPTDWPVAFDIDVQIPGTLGIQGKDLHSSWKGNLAIKGDTTEPLIFGEIKILDGQYLFNGKPFALSEGTITFSGEPEKKVFLYIIASKDLEKVKIDVIVKGPAKHPSITFRSNPPLSQREILSWLLFNRGTSEVTSFQGAQITETIDNLENEQQGPDLLTKIRSSLGIDCFDITRKPQGDVDGEGVSIRVGKYISDNILISVTKSEVNTVSVEANLTEHIKLQAEVGDNAEGQLLLKWKKDY